MGRFYRGMSCPRQVRGFRKCSGKSPSQLLPEYRAELEKRRLIYPEDSMMITVLKDAIVNFERMLGLDEKPNAKL